MCRVELYDISYLFPVSIDLSRITINDASFLVLVDHITKIAIGEKIDIDHPVVIRYVILFNLCELLQVIIQYGDPALIPDVFINQEIPPDLTRDLEIQPAGIIFIIFGINDFLRRGGK